MKLDDAKALAEAYMEHHKLTVAGWRFEFNDSKTFFGRCNFTRKLILLSAPLTLLNDELQVEDTILHEIAHALAGSKAGHGKLWKAVAVSVGANPERCYDTAEVTQPEGRYKAVCPGCQQAHFMYRRRTSKKRVACTNCCKKYNGGRFSERFLLNFVPNVNVFLQSAFL